MTAPYPIFTPPWTGQNDGTALGWKSCTCVIGSTEECGNTQGHDVLPWRQIRNATGDFDGGTTFDQVDAAIAQLTGQDHLSTGYFTRDVIESAWADGKAFGMAVFYGPVHRAGRALLDAGEPNTVSGQENGFGEHPDDWHAMLFLPKLEAEQTIVVQGTDAFGRAFTTALTGPGRPAYDPLCDGRRPTVAKGVVLYSDDLVDAVFAESQLWRGKAYGSITLPWTLPAAPVERPAVHYRFGAVQNYRGIWRVKKPVAFRSQPWIHTFDRQDNVVGVAKVGRTFRVYQALAKPNGRVFLGNATGDKWVLLNHNRIEAVK